MISFEKFDPARREEYEALLHCGRERGCEYAFANLNLWGRQRCAFLGNFLVIFSQFGKQSVYPYPVGQGDIGSVLDAIIADARERGIVCRLSGLSAEECMELEERYPGRFQFHPDRDSCDYVYKIEDLAELKGRKFQKKRNHLNKFKENHPNCEIRLLDSSCLEQVRQFAENWYAKRLEADPQGDFHLEQRALSRALCHGPELGLEGIVLMEQGEILAFALGSRLSGDTFDIHFEKAREDIDGAYPAVNQAFAAHLASKYPEIRWLNREDDLGLPGLRKAKLSYQPHHLVVKFWARLWESDDED